MKLKYILSSAVLALGLASCSNEVQEAISDQQVPLQISASIEGTRAAGVEDREFYESESIGITVAGIDNAFNVRGQYNGSNWNISPSISIPYGEYFVSAYYPYDEKIVQKENRIEFNVSAGINHLLSYTWVYTDDKAPAVAKMTFKHIMSRVRIEVSGAADKLLESVEISGNNIYKTALGVIDGYSYYFKPNGDGAIIVQNTKTDASEVQTVDALLIPESNGEANITLNFAGGKKYTKTVSLPELKMGGYYRLPITLKENEDKPEDNPTHEGHEYVDLGLPSGLKWATCNVGAKSPEEYGDYFAWGETEPKENYSWETYKWCKGTDDTMTKYCTDSKYGTVDNKTTLDPEDDAATANWGGKWRMPTDSEYEELIKHCTWTWTSMYDIKGYKITGTNGNWIFLPAGSNGWDGDYWSSTLSSRSSMCSCSLRFMQEEHYTGISNRRNGQSVRPVTE